MTAPPSTRLDFLGFGIELMIYGIYVVLFGTAVSYLTWKRKSAHIHKFYLSTCCLLFACASIHVFIKFRYMYIDLLVRPLPGEVLEAGTPALWFADAIVTLNDFFAEVVLLYRCWVVWDCNYWIMVIPVLSSLAFVSCAMATVALFATIPSGSPIIPPAILPLGSAAFGIPLIVNVMVSGLIVGRILYLGRASRQRFKTYGSRMPSQTYIQFAVTIIVEAGLIYLVTQLAMTTLFMLHHDGQLLMSNISTQVYGIASTLIIVRSSLGPGQKVTEYRDSEGRNAAVDSKSPRSINFATVGGGTLVQEQTISDVKDMDLRPLSTYGQAA